MRHLNCIDCFNAKVALALVDPIGDEDNHAKDPSMSIQHWDQSPGRWMTTQRNADLLPSWFSLRHPYDRPKMVKVTKACVRRHHARRRDRWIKVR